MGGYNWFFYFVFSVPELLMLVFFGMQLGGVFRIVNNKKEIFLVGILPSFIISLYYFYTREHLFFIPMMMIHHSVVFLLVFFSSSYKNKNWFRGALCGLLSFVPLLGTEQIMNLIIINFFGGFELFSNRIGLIIFITLFRYIPVFGLTWYLNKKDVVINTDCIKNWIDKQIEKL